jgi:hypothetical protein
VFGLHSGDGRLLWSLACPPGRRPSHIALWRTSHDAATAPEVLLLGNLQDGPGAFYSSVDAHRGAETAAGDLPLRLAQVASRFPCMRLFPLLLRPARQAARSLPSGLSKAWMFGGAWTVHAWAEGLITAARSCISQASHRCSYAGLLWL